jgi:hypothetical protein
MRKIRFKLQQIDLLRKENATLATEFSLSKGRKTNTKVQTANYKSKKNSFSKYWRPE